MKKHKTWDGDGVLAVTGGYARLQNIDGREMGRCMYNEPLLPGSTLSIGGKDIEIDAPITKADFLAGRPFLNNGSKSSVPDRGIGSAARPSPYKSHQQQTVMPQNKNGAPAPRHDPSAPGAIVMPRPNPKYLAKQFKRRPASGKHSPEILKKNPVVASSKFRVLNRHGTDPSRRSETSSKDIPILDVRGDGREIYQRQITKMGLADSVIDGKKNEASFSADELRDLFRLDVNAHCQTHELLGCDCGGSGRAEPAASTSDMLEADKELSTGEEDNKYDDDDYDTDDAEFPIDPACSLVPATKANVEAQQKIALEAARGKRSKTGKKMQALMEYNTSILQSSLLA
ncbi:hypothetical protein DID88_006598 [Monilinia fructigena]|uniref:DUF2439 domain-containing protein n=1 Tax=Monilinia fructigena TaxID=38457 RepID=A0A395IJG8_9HELO|nr:hypothetical protein DID88_006598 [Monilinia fructigena]